MRYLKHAASRVGLALRDPEQRTVVVHVADASLDDLMGTHSKQQRHHRGDRASVALVTAPERLLQPHPGLVNAKLRLPLVAPPLPLHRRERVLPEQPLRDTPSA